MNHRCGVVVSLLAGNRRKQDAGSSERGLGTGNPLENPAKIEMGNIGEGNAMRGEAEKAGAKSVRETRRFHVSPRTSR